MSLVNHVRNAVHQLKCGETIGRRGTPVISFWPPRPKWDKWGEAWETTGTDGDSLQEDGMLVIPAVLKLVYFRCANGEVCQIAYVLHPESKGYPGPNMDRAAMEYDRARSAMPERLAAT